MVKVRLRGKERYLVRYVADNRRIGDQERYGVRYMAGGGSGDQDTVRDTVHGRKSADSG
ncbi:hypothetical protein [Paenibacillus sp. UNC496MF]|uniref:hypothetical protein n=1 Tax=Paenibacillus sp. UNC496MF TaxID=1502753 RepID=UPI0015A5934B|nr:hypothetical protein [Paenibacillus sp. UNC496MF]